MIHQNDSTTDVNVIDLFSEASKSDQKIAHESAHADGIHAGNDSLPNGPSNLTNVLQIVGPIGLGLAVAALFYVAVVFANWAPLNRYFLGHPVAIAATVLFSVGISILATMAIGVSRQRSQLNLLRDEDLTLSWADQIKAESPAEQWKLDNDAGHLARLWRTSLSRLPAGMQASLLVQRLDEVLARQCHRGTTGELAEDLREISVRDADAAHDSLGLVRIIVWAIPMLGFLGTVIGITQTLGGLDFTDGTAAVDRLKSGLYVAFDTTALGLVLSVVAIFLQFPVERAQQGLLADIDIRVRSLVSAVLPGDDASENQTTLVTQLCEGIRVAVAESLATQAKLWRETIEEAQQSWRTQHNEGAEQFQRMVQSALQPALTSHADRMEATVSRLESSAETVGQSLREQTTAWRNAFQETAVEVQTHRRTLLTHTEAMTSLASKQATGDESLRQAIEMVKTTSAEVGTNAPDNTMADAMRTLAQAVEILSSRVTTAPAGTAASLANQTASTKPTTRRAA